MINTVQKSFDSLTAKNNFKCEECDFTINTKEGMKLHVERDHTVICEDCDEKYAGERKLKTHMCRVHVKNPTKNELYMKNWFIKNECIRVFSEKRKKEIAIIHSDLCVKNYTCTYVLPTFISQLRYIDNTDFIHLHASDFITDQEVQWEILTESMESLET